MLYIKQTYNKRKDGDCEKFSFEEYVNLKLEYEKLLEEMNLFTAVKKEKESLLAENDHLFKENRSMKKDLSLKDERIRSLENTSFELAPIKTDNEKEFLKKEITKYKADLDLHTKRVYQLENDLAETDESFEKANEKATNLEKQLEKVRVYGVRNTMLWQAGETLAST